MVEGLPQRANNFAKSPTISIYTGHYWHKKNSLLSKMTLLSIKVGAIEK
jgi:hypothetical protein